MRIIRVVAAIICDDMNKPSRIFATQRGYGDMKGGWEFPGGKIEAGETPQQALVREIKEELDTEIVVGDLLETVEYDYPDFHLSMNCFMAQVITGDLILKEAQDCRWLTREMLYTVNWLPADMGLIDKLKEFMRQTNEN